MPKRIIVASGYFDPLHYGHVEYLQRSKDKGDKLIVIVNNDNQAKLKKGFVVTPARERVMLIREMECVDMAIESIDSDRTVCRTLSILHPHAFANGGDQTNDSIPEAEVCRELDIELIDGLGDKVQSSRWIVNEIKNIFSSEKVNEYLEGGTQKSDVVTELVMSKSNSDQEDEY
jgi:cytidyltransferase-like protein